jgi:urease accessory protein
MMPREPDAATATSGWNARLELRYRHDGTRCIGHSRHHGPLRVLQSLYPEGPAICHHVLVHPPGGVVGGDSLEVDLAVERGAHALVTTAGATRFYRTAGPLARQQARLAVAQGARLEWLPLETIAYSGCDAGNAVELDIAGEAMGWEMLALGLPAAGEPFAAGRFEQQLHAPGRWLERGVIAAADTALLRSPLGLAGCPVLATLWFVAGAAWATAQAAALIDEARAAIELSPLAPRAGVTQPQPGVLVLRALAGRVEPAMALLSAVRAAWRRLAWGLPAHPPRVWRM